MADRTVYYDPKIVLATDLNRQQTDAENADKRLLLDHLGAGVAYGLGLTETGTPDMHLTVAVGVAYDASGARVELAAPASPNFATDYLSASTAVTAGNERYVSLFIRQTRVDSEAYSDPAASPTTGYLRSTESSALRVVSGTMATAGTATLPAPPDANHVLLGTIKRTFGQTALRTRDVILGGVEIAHRAADVYDDSIERSLECSPTDPPSLSVVVSAGDFQFNGTRYHFAGGSVSLGSAPSVNPRIDLVCITSALTLLVSHGAEASTPAYPSTHGLVPIAFVGVDVADVAVMDEDILDARPWFHAESALARVFRMVAAGGETAIDLSFSYQTGAHALIVTLNGSVLDETQYTESTSTRITVSALTAADVLVVKASEVQPIAALPLASVTDDLSGLMEGPSFVEVTSGGAALNVGAIRCCVIANVRRFTAVTTSVTIGSLSANTWYYLYAAPDDPTGPTALKFVLTTTAPDAATGYVFQTGDTTRRYIASVRSDATSTLIPMRKTGSGVHGHTVWRRTDALIALTTLLSSGAAGSWTTVSCAGLVPPHARLARFRLKLGGDAVGGTAEVRTQGTTAGSLSISSPAITGGMQITEEVELEVDSSNRLEYEVSGGSSVLTIYATSFEG